MLTRDYIKVKFRKFIFINEAESLTFVGKRRENKTDDTITI